MAFPRPVSMGTWTAIAILCAMLRPASASACAVCACGDPTLTVMGSAQPFDQRLRLALAVQHRTDEIGSAGVDRVELSEQRLTLSAAYAPVKWLMLSASAPLVRRSLKTVSLAEETFVDVGDAELRARAFVFQDRDFAPEHLFAVVAGLKFPTGPVQRDASGNYREPELSPGSGSFDPLVGVSYTFLRDPWSLYLSEVVTIPTDSRADWRMGTSWLGTHVIQHQFDTTWAARMGVNTRLDEKTQRDTGVEPDTGGFILFLMPSLVVSPITDLVLNLDVNIPVLNALTGNHDEGLFVSLGVAHDF